MINTLTIVRPGRPTVTLDLEDCCDGSFEPTDLSLQDAVDKWGDVEDAGAYIYFANNRSVANPSDKFLADYDDDALTIMINPAVKAA